MDPAAYQILSASLRARLAGENARIELVGADLSDARLPRANLAVANLAGCRLDYANLAGAKLSKANLKNSQIRWAQLNGANFTAADLRGADMSGAQVEGACFADADMRGASVDGATGEPATIAGARIDHAMCARSGLDDFDIIQLWRAGATIEDLGSFSAQVQHACGFDDGAQESPPSEMGAPARKLSQVGLKAHRNRLDSIGETPPELAISVVTPDTPSVRPPARVIAVPPKPVRRPVRGPRMSMRTMRLVSEVLTPAMLQAPAWKSGDVVMGVTLQELIGKGSAAHVWRGSNDDGEALAVKLFDSQCVNRGLSLPAYRRGVQVMNRLVELPNVAQRLVRLHSVSLNQLGYVMAEAPNGSACDLPALNWSTDSALDFFKKLCDGVQQAHDAGILHRCIKPSNVLLDDELEPLLSDFDMVDLPWLAGNVTDAAGYSLFAAPEELAGAGTQSPTADIYSLGSFLYFLLARELPPIPLARLTDYQALAKHPQGLCRIIRKCTANAPSHRYQYVSELLADLDNYQDANAVGRAFDGDEAAVSSLTQSRPWLGHTHSTSEPASRVKSERPARATDRASRASKHNSEQEKSKRNTEIIVGTAGAMLLLVSLLVVEFSPPANKELMAGSMRLVSALSGSLLVFFFVAPKKHHLIWRLLMVLFAITLLYVLDLPGLFAEV